MQLASDSPELRRNGDSRDGVNLNEATAAARLSILQINLWTLNCRSPTADLECRAVSGERTLVGVSGRRKAGGKLHESWPTRRLDDGSSIMDNIFRAIFC